MLTSCILVKTPSSDGDEADIKKKEESIMELGSMLAANKQTQELRKVCSFILKLYLTVNFR